MIGGIALTVSVLALIASATTLTTTLLDRGRIARMEARLDAQMERLGQPAPSVALSAAEQPQPAPPQQQQDQDAANLALANLGSDDIDILPAGPGGGDTYAYIRPTRQWMRFDPAGTPEQIDAGLVPEQMRRLAAARAEADVPTTQPVADPGDQARNAEASIPALTGDIPDLALNALLAQPDVAAPIIAALDQLAAIEVPGPDTDQRLFVFFDPRCPYCHQAFEALDGKIAMTWIPVLALGDTADGRQIAATLIGATEKTSVTRNGEAREGVALADDPDRVERLRAQMGGKTLAASGSPELDDGVAFALEENITVLRQLYGKQTDLLGVPTFVQTRQDGTAIMYRGYDIPTVQALLAQATQAQSAPAVAKDAGAGSQ